MENTVTISVKEYDDLRELKKNYTDLVAECEAKTQKIYIYWYSSMSPITVKNISEAERKTLEILQVDLARTINNASFWKRLKYLFTKQLNR